MWIAINLLDHTVHRDQVTRYAAAGGTLYAAARVILGKAIVKAGAIKGVFLAAVQCERRKGGGLERQDILGLWQNELGKP